MTTIHADELLPGDVVRHAGTAHRVDHVDCRLGWAFPVAFGDDGWAIALGHELLDVERAEGTVRADEPVGRPAREGRRHP
jgi:hypothetical protein